MSKLIVNADDFGLHSAVNAGIIDGHRRGIITSTSLMAGGEAFTEAVSMAKQNPKLGIGIHITLVGGVKQYVIHQKFHHFSHQKVYFQRTM